MFQKTYGVLLIGCGYIGALHIQDIYFHENVNLIGVVDYKEEQAKLFARKYDAESWSTDYRDYLENERVDIVIIATYTSTHISILLDCIAHGKHVLCEKPLSDHLPSLLDCIQKIKASEQKVLIGHILRHSPTYLKVKELIDSGAIGELKVLRMVQNHHALDWPRYRALLRQTSPIVDCGVHYMDVAQWFTGHKITKLSGVGTILDEEVTGYNYGMLHMTLDDGTVAYFEAGWSKNISGSHVKEFIGTKGHLKIIMDCDRPSRHNEGDMIEFYETQTQTYHTINMRSGVKNMWGQFCSLVDMIENNSPADPSMADVESSMRVAFAADQAILSGKEILLDPITQEIIN